MGRVNVTLVAVPPVVCIAAICRARLKMHFLDPFLVQNRAFQFQDFRAMDMHATCRSPTSPSIYGGGGFATRAVEQTAGLVGPPGREATPSL